MLVAATLLNELPHENDEITDRHEQTLGPIVCGALTSGLGQRSIFWFLTISSGTGNWLAFCLFFGDTFRKERSLTYQEVLKELLRQGKRRVEHNSSESRLCKPAWNAVEHTATIPNISGNHPEIELLLKDVTPFKPIRAVLRRINSLVIITASGKCMSLPDSLLNADHYQLQRSFVRSDLHDQLYQCEDSQSRLSL
jgi:hypothetical protein